MNTRVPPSTAALPLRETKYRELEQYPEFGSVTAWLRDVVSSIVPNARMSECEYWSVVCLPTGEPDDPRKPLVSVHAGNMAVAGVFLDLSDGQRSLAGYVRVSGPELEKASGSTREQLAADSPDLSFVDEGSVVSVVWSDEPAAREQFEALPWRAPARALVTELMRGGRNCWADDHCRQIARFAYDD
ncbi:MULTISPECIES: hypothetical protein [Rhodococcus]|uniref:hypothetical protein n=1 Tax=Rhodococcus TaxID=1827 RepID=UPI000B5A377D|nr:MULTISPECIES: hypothetical protein [Rhodococcus]OWY82077.1 hypothetical protein B9C99_09645 [Rhodococcus sp. BUPNP1]QHG82784.1 hypothetical protein D1O33_13090 [Rhodococcus rhodochrous]QOH57535.1 hypothetical protein C6Y44_17375 [Rhodococcus rhodochrous]